MTELSLLTGDTAQAAVHELVRLLTKISGPKIAAVFRDRPDKRLLILQSVGRDLRAELGPRRANAVMELGALLNGLQVGTPGPGQRDEAAEIEQELRAKLAGHAWPGVYRLAARAVVAWHLGFRTRNLSLADPSHPWEEEVEGALARARSASGPSKKTKAKLRRLARVYLAGSVGATLHGCFEGGWWWGYWPPIESVSFIFEAVDLESAAMLVTAAASKDPEEEVASLAANTIDLVWELRDCVVSLARALGRQSTLSAAEVKRLMNPPDPDEIFPERDPLYAESRRELDRRMYQHLREALSPYRARGVDDLRWVYSKRLFVFTRFKRAMDYLACHAPVGSKLVHAEVLPIYLAWVEVPAPRGVIYDPVLQELYEPAGYRQVMQPRRIKRYGREDALRRLLRAGHYGPWIRRLWLDDEPSRPTESELRRYRRILNEVH